MKTPYLSVVIPAFNEEDIIEENLKEVLSYMSSKRYSSEILVVDDGSRDKTVNIVEKIKKVKLLKHKQNRGKGAALKTGVLAAEGKFVVFMDADLSVPLEFIDDIVKELSQSEVAIGSRRISGSIIKKHQPFLRESMGRVFTKLTQLIMGSSVVDFTCGFKGFTKAAADKIFGASLIERWAYDAEIVFLAHKFGYKIAQVPVVWVNREETRVKVGKAAIESLIDLFRVRFYDLLGKYEN